MKIATGETRERIISLYTDRIHPSLTYNKFINNSIGRCRQYLNDEGHVRLYPLITHLKTK